MRGAQRAPLRSGSDPATSASVLSTACSASWVGGHRRSSTSESLSRSTPSSDPRSIPAALTPSVWRTWRSRAGWATSGSPPAALTASACFGRSRPISIVWKPADATSWMSSAGRAASGGLASSSRSPTRRTGGMHTSIRPRPRRRLGRARVPVTNQRRRSTASRRTRISCCTFGTFTTSCKKSPIATSRLRGSVWNRNRATWPARICSRSVRRTRSSGRPSPGCSSLSARG